MLFGIDRSIQRINKTLRHGRALLGMVVALLFLTACKDSRVDNIQNQIDRLQQVIDTQRQTLQNLTESQLKIETELSEFSDIKFEITDVQFEILEKAFEPLIVGHATLTIDGERKPELVFVEWSLVLIDGTEPLAPMSFIQRVENGETSIHFAQSLPSHSIKKDNLTIKIVPTGWYLGHLAQLK